MPPALREPVLVSSADGVGTKLKVAFMTGRHDTVGADLVNHCVNDILVQGARPLFFLDYLATGRLSPDVAEQVIVGVARGCRENGCALLGGETAEMPGFYADGEYDIAGFIVGVVDRPRADRREDAFGRAMCSSVCRPRACTPTATRSRAACSSTCVAYAPDTVVPELGVSIGEALLAPHRSYLRAVRPLLEAGLVKGMAHITGGGITENLPRVLPDGCAAIIDPGAWTVPPLFRLLQPSAAQIATDEMFRAFNMGIGLIIVVPRRGPAARDRPRSASAGESPIVIGQVTSRRPDGPLRGHALVNRRIAVLISGRGSQPAIDHRRDRRRRAGRADRSGRVQPSRGGRARSRARRWHSSRLPRPARFLQPGRIRPGDRRCAAARAMSALVCLAGFMRLVGPPLLDAFPNRILNIHPSLLPSFPGLDAQQQALSHGVRVSGATVHLVTAELDGGPIVMQSAVPVLDGRHGREPGGAHSGRGASHLSRSDSASCSMAAGGSTAADSIATRRSRSGRLQRQHGDFRRTVHANRHVDRSQSAADENRGVLLARPCRRRPEISAPRSRQPPAARPGRRACGPTGPAGSFSAAASVRRRGSWARSTTVP